MPKLTPEQLLSEIEDALRTMPDANTLRFEHAENYSWLGRAAALVAEWNPARSILFNSSVRELHAAGPTHPSSAIAGILTMLQQARHDLRSNVVGPLSVAINHGAVFEYFDEIRKVIATAKLELLFIDPYMDAEFVSRYLPQVSPGVRVRLLGRFSMPSLLPALALAVQQYSLCVEVRQSSTLHDRFLFLDGALGYQSGASFKDGAKKAPTALIQITDAFDAMKQTYESIWNSATPQAVK